MTEREIKHLIKLLLKFRECKTKSGVLEFTGREQTIIGTVLQWVKWHGRDELDMDL